MDDPQNTNHGIMLWPSHINVSTILHETNTSSFFLVSDEYLKLTSDTKQLRSWWISYNILENSSPSNQQPEKKPQLQAVSLLDSGWICGDPNRDGLQRSNGFGHHGSTGPWSWHPRGWWWNFWCLCQAQVSNIDMVPTFFSLFLDRTDRGLLTFWVL